MLMEWIWGLSSGEESRTLTWATAGLFPPDGAKQGGGQGRERAGKESEMVGSGPAKRELPSDLTAGDEGTGDACLELSPEARSLVCKTVLF